MKPKSVAFNGREIEEPITASTLGLKLVEKFNFAKDSSESLYVYEDGVYKSGGEASVRQQVKDYVCLYGKPSDWSTHLTNEVIAFILVGAPLLWPQPPDDVINLQIGLLNLRTRQFELHHSGFLSPVQLPISFDPEARCPTWDYLIDTSFPEDAQDLGYEIPAWVMSPSEPTQVAVLLVGEGANGKSVYLNGLGVFLGANNVSGVSLHKLEKDRFAAARLMGKLANICPDIPNNKLFGTSIFKALTGGDLIHAERKFKESFEFRSYAKLIFSTNQPPQADDSTYGFSRRWRVVPFERTYVAGSAGHFPRRDLDAMLSSPEELSGLLNRALEVWPPGPGARPEQPEELSGGAR